MDTTKVMKPFLVSMHYDSLMKLKNIPKDIIPRDIIETVLQHMAAHHGISPSVIEKNKLEPHVVGYIEQFNEIDEVSRITNMPRNEKNT